MLFATPDGEPFAQAAGIDFHPYGQCHFSPEVNAQRMARLGRLNGVRALREAERLLAARAALRLAEVPDAARQQDVDALLVDQSSPDGGTIAERLDVPFVSVCGALLLNRDPDVPPFNTLWRYRTSVWARTRNRLGNLILDRITATSRRVTADYRRSWRLTPTAAAQRPALDARAALPAARGVRVSAPAAAPLPALLRSVRERRQPRTGGLSL